jgi:hypothetical protein
MKIVVAGGTGLIGSALVKGLRGARHSIVVLTRDPDKMISNSDMSVTFDRWDGKTVGGWQDRIDGADAVFNFSGESLAARRWTRVQKERLLNSRLEATQAIVQAIERAKRKPGALVNVSAVGYYGDVEEGEVTEARGPGNGFLADLCRKWEEAAHAAGSFGVRVVTPRLGVVLAGHGSALQQMILPFKLFAGGPLGSGRQWFPWIHIDDVVSVALFVLDNVQLSGAVNVAAPESVTMKQFCSALGKTLHRPSWTPVPAIALRIALGEMSQMLLTGQRVVPAKLMQSGYSFRFPNLDAALAAAIDHPANTRRG